MTFEKHDIGKLVSIELKTKDHTLARLLRAESVTVFGKVEEVHEKYVLIQAMTPRYTPLTPRHSSQKKIPYDTIKDYAFEEDR
jgi:hypothetical protein